MQGIAHLAIDFTVQVLAGIVGVFVGVFFALVLERRRREQDALERDADQMQGFDRAVDSVLGSVVKNIAEAKRILGALASRKGALLVHAELESSVWFATQAQFIALCPNVDQRVIVAQFFDEVRRLQAFSDFRSNILVRRITTPLQHDDSELLAVVADIDRHLADLAEDVRMCGMMLINDHGKPVHKRLIGMRTAVPS